MTRYKELNGKLFKEVKEIPCGTYFGGKSLAECYKTYSLAKFRAFNWWTNWKARVNIGFYARITDMYISSHTPQFFTLVFKGYTLPEDRNFTIAVTASNIYIKYED